MDFTTPRPKPVLKEGNILVGPTDDDRSDVPVLTKSFPMTIFDMIKKALEEQGDYDIMVNCDLGKKIEKLRTSGVF